MAKKGRKLPPHIVLPDGRWRFIKRGSKKPKIGGRKPMARKSVRHYARGARGKLGMLAPALGGAAENIINNYIPVPGVGTALVGFGLKNQFCKDYGLYQLGYYGGGMVGNMFGGNTGTTGGGNAGVLY